VVPFIENIKLPAGAMRDSDNLFSINFLSDILSLQLNSASVNPNVLNPVRNEPIKKIFSL